MKQFSKIVVLMLAVLLNLSAFTGVVYAETPEETIERLEKEVDVLAEANKLLTEAIAALTEANETLKEALELIKSGWTTTGEVTTGETTEVVIKKATDPIKSVYSAAEREKIAKLDLDEAKKMISTVEDAAHYFGMLGYKFYSSTSSTGFDLSFSHAQSKLKSASLAPNVVSALTAYLLQDDYPEMGFVVAPVEHNGRVWGLGGVYIKTDDAYHVISIPHIMRELKYSLSSNSPDFKTLEIKSFDEMIEKLELTRMGKGEKIVQLFSAKYQEKLNFKITTNLFELTTGQATEVYRLSDEAIAKAAAEKARETLVTLEKTLKSKGFTSKGLTLSIDEVMALVGSGLENVKNKCKSLEDVLFFLAATGSKQASGDIQTKDSSGAYTWHFNYSVSEVYRQNTSNCGATASYVAYLLHGDYEEVGLLTMRGENGGHVINYVKDNGVYFTVDVNSYHGSSYNVNSMGYKTAADLITAGQNAAKRYPYYSAFATKWTSSDPTDGDVAVGWDSSKLVRIPSEYKADTVIVLEDPAAGYTFEWVDVSKNTWAKINALRNG